MRRRKIIDWLPLLILIGCLGCLQCVPSRKSQAAGKGGSSTARVRSRTLTARSTLPTPKSSLHAMRSASARRAALKVLDQVKHKNTAPVESPIALTAADGTGLQLLSLEARAVVEEPLVFTELHLVFRNPRPRVVEGRFSITLPEGAAVSRFAMLLPHGWQEAEVVERQRARQVYESFLHQRQDPALLEKKAGNAFRARVFPIPASGLKEIKIAYSEQIRGSADPYTLHLRGLPRVDRLDIEVLLGRRPITHNRATMGATLIQKEIVRLSKKAYRPAQDFKLALSNKHRGRRNGNLVVARVSPTVSLRPDHPGSLLILVDTSASRSAGFPAQVERLRALIKTLAERHGDNLPALLACFDQVVDPIYRGPIGGLSPRHMRQILARQALGASDLSRALLWAAQSPGFSRVLLVSDGVITAGETRGARLRQLVSRLKPAGVERMDVVMVGGIRDEAMMRRLVSGTLPREGVVLDQDLPAAEMVKRLGQRALSGIEVVVPGARWIWPSVLHGVQPGHQELIFADIAPARLNKGKLQVTLSGSVREKHSIALEPAPRHLIERAWAQANIARLEHQRDTLGDGSKEEAQKIREEIVQLSTRFRVVSAHTAMLVLETEGDYRRFGLKRSALANILAVGPDGVQVLRRSRGRRQGPRDIRRRVVRHPGDQGAMGSVAARRARRSASSAASSSGMLGILGSSRGQDSLFGKDSARGSSVRADALGGLIGDQVGKAHGKGGLGLRGTGSGGGGSGEIGLGTLGTIGKGGGGGSGAGYGRGRASGVGRGAVVRGRAVSAVEHRARQAARRARLARSTAPLSLRAHRPSAPMVRAGRAVVRGSLDRGIIRRVIRRHLNEVRYCYQRELQANPSLQGRVSLRFTIAPTGRVTAAGINSSTVRNSALEQCIARSVSRWRFPAPMGGGTVVVNYPFALRRAGGPPLPPLPSTPRPRKPRQLDEPGRFTRVKDLLRRGHHRQALVQSLKWRASTPGSILSLVALGEAAVALQNEDLAARVFGSIIDLYPSRADMRRFAATRLEGLGQPGLTLAADSLARATTQRPDHVTGYRLLAMTELRRHRPRAAFEALEAGLSRRYPGNRFAGYKRVLVEDLGLVAAAWIRRAPRAARASILSRLQRAGARLPRAASLRFVLTWETDANDVDLHVYDAKGGHAFFSQQDLPSGGRLYGDVTTGYGPECFAIEGNPAAGPYRLKVHYYSRGPMGYGMGKVQVIAHDGKGGLTFEDRPFVITRDGQEVMLGKAG